MGLQSGEGVIRAQVYFYYLDLSYLATLSNNTKFHRFDAIAASLR